MRQYLDLVHCVLNHGEDRPDRTGVGTRSQFGAQLRFDLSDHFPLLTAKKTSWKAIAYELLWFLKGSSNIKFLRDNGITIWDEWADAQGDLGPIYGVQWRSWPDRECGENDQIANVIKSIRENPYSRRHIVSAWNVSDLKFMKLEPCHVLFQFYVSNDKKLSCHLYQRSADLFLGVPFNIASYALLTHMVAHVCQLNVGDFIHSFGDVHLYKNHLPQAQDMLNRPIINAKPQLRFKHAVSSIDDFTFEDFILENYYPHPTIKAPVAV